MMNSLKQKCATYETFGECEFGRNCFRSHNVWPYRTGIAVGTIVTEDIELPGVIAFHTESNDGNSRTHQYYILRRQWFSADAGSGDIVKISVSEKVHQGSDCCFARICKILKSATMPRIPPLMPAGLYEQRDCLDFITYKDCIRGERCSYTHDVTSAYAQRFHVAKVLSVISFRANSKEVQVDVKSDHVGLSRTDGRPKAFYVLDKFSCNVREGNLVIIQESSRLHEHKGIHFGKVTAILHESQGLWENEVALEVCAKPGIMFLLSHNSEGLRQSSVMAYSTESCSYHENCRKIGVHNRAAALGMHIEKLDQYFVPHHRKNVGNLPKGFEVDTIRLALSLYFHSASEEVEGPYLTPVFIDSDSIYRLIFNDAPKYQPFLKHMWSVFRAKSFIASVVNSLAANYMANFPKTWKERYVIRQAVDLFNQGISRYMQSKEGKFVMVRKRGVITGINAQDAVIPAENLEMVKSAWQSPTSRSSEEREIALGFLLGSVKGCAEEFWEEQLCDRYTWEVVSCDNIQGHQTVITTSPIAQTVDFLNQQTVLSLMISPLTSLYSKNDILGCINRRHHTPIIIKAAIRQLTKTVVCLQLRGILGRRRGNREIWLKEIFECQVVSIKPSICQDSDAGESNEPVDEISLLLENLTSEDYCNSKLVRLTGEQVATLSATTIEQGVNSDKTASDVLDLLATHEEYEAPYQVNEKSTLVTLGRGVELQLQISLKEDDSNDGGQWLRLLRIGKDCHRCLLHSNSPVKAFFSGRQDAASLIAESSLKLMPEKIASNSLTTVTLKELNIEWNDCYFSGGTFSTKTTIKPRNLLCIRKEIVGNGDQSIFVWTCHAVVSEVCENRVRFLVCSLFQDLTPEMWAEIENAHFIVEVIDIDEENNISDQ